MEYVMQWRYIVMSIEKVKKNIEKVKKSSVNFVVG